MPPKRARADKSVLSRQAIASRRRQLSDKKLHTSGAGRRAVFGVLLLAGSLLGLVALATFNVKDRVGPGFRNAAGPVGHSMAEALHGLLGICSYVLPLSGIYAAAILFVGARDKRRWPQVLSSGLFCVSGAVLAQLVLGENPGWTYPPGGAIGLAVGGFSAELFSTVGTVILVSALCAVALIVGTQFVFLRLVSIVHALLSAVARQARDAVLAFWNTQKAALVKGREEAARAKLEEAAFLAQLEADEEELDAAERDAAEADLIAEEAHRLAQLEAQKQAEKAAKQAEKLAKQLAKENARSPKALPPGAVLPVVNDSLPPGSLLPGADPAWASILALPECSAAAHAQPLESARKKKTPQIVTPPVSSPPTPPAEALMSSVAAPVLAAAAASAAVVRQVVPPGAAIVPAPPVALARTPLIVEPKAPPVPSKKTQEQFEFVGDRKHFNVPPMSVLECDKHERTTLDKETFLITAEKLRSKLADFGIVGEVVEIRPGPVVTMYEFLPGPGIKVSKIAALQDDLAMAMEAMRVRIVAPIPGKGVVGIEVPNKDRETVYLKEIAEQDAFTKASSKLTMCVGKDIEGMPYLLDLAKAPHLLMAGTTGSGKSVAVNSMIMSILLKATPEEVRFIMVDPKMLELSVYEGIPHLLLPVVTDPKKAALALLWAVEEMERRYHLLSAAGVRNITGYNKLVDSVAGPAKDLMTTNETKIKRAPRVEAARRVSEGLAPNAPSPSGKRKMLIVDVAEGETEEQARERAAAGGEAAFGVPSPFEAEEIREESTERELEPVPVSAEPEMDLEPVLEEEIEALPPEGLEAAKKEELKKLPYIVVIIDELADLMMVASREVETYIARLAQMARAAGIHLMVATQRPSTDVVTGVIKANFPTRISFMLRSKPDSMTILGTVGAEALLGMGDMLIMPPTSAHMQRVHGAYVSEVEIKRAVDHLKAQGKPVYDDTILKPRDDESEGGAEDEDMSDELWDQALATVSDMRNVSISMLQRKMRIGYNRAARMIERMEREGIVGPADGAKPREVLLRPVGEMPGAGA
ncbi:MAG: DNA translocase FtsK 4TM domain-containing protein [Myxococcaceae bacterium]